MLHNLVEVVAEDARDWVSQKCEFEYIRSSEGVHDITLWPGMSGQGGVPWLLLVLLWAPILVEEVYQPGT